MTSTGIPMKRRWSYRRVLSVTVAITVATLAVTSCWETDVDDSLYIRNDSDLIVRVDYEWSSGERLPLLGALEPGEVSPLDPPVDPDVEVTSRCTTGPLIVSHEGEEVQRFNAPVCFEHGRTLTVDGEQ